IAVTAAAALVSVLVLLLLLLLFLLLFTVGGALAAADTGDLLLDLVHQALLVFALPVFPAVILLLLLLMVNIIVWWSPLWCSPLCLSSSFCPPPM
ncbi:hypothetical protein CISIN_1g048035mg, partial [Citrus sinensis]